MYLRSTPRKNKDGSEVRYLQLAHNVWDPQKRRSSVRVVYNFGREDAANREALQRLAASVTRFLDPDAALAASGDGLDFTESRPLGGTWVLDALWSRLGIGKEMRRLLKGRRRDETAERVLFALVANRALAPSSKLAASRWVNEDVLVAGLPSTSDDACYRAMDWLTEIKDDLERKVFGNWLPAQPGSGPAVLRHHLHLLRDGRRRRAGGPRRLRHARASGNGDGGEDGDGAGRVPDLGEVQGPPRRPAAGRHRDGRDEGRDPGPRLVLARGHLRLGADPAGEGRHARLVPVEGHLGRRPRLHLRGEPPLPAQGGGSYIIGEKLRSGSADAQAALSRQGRYKDVAGNLKVKEVRISDDERFVICFNPEAAERDAAVRGRMIARLEEMISDSDQLSRDKRAELAA